MKKKGPVKKKSTRKQKPQVSYFGWRLIYFVGIVIVLGGLLFSLMFKQNKVEECANSISCIKDLSGNYDENNVGEYEGKPVTGPAIAGSPSLASNFNQATNVLGDTTADAKHIYVDLSKQKLYAYENNNLVYEFDVSTGKPWWPTPTGDFRIWIKLRYTRMKGGTGAGYYDLPNVPYTMFLYNAQVPKYKGYGIHGAYWHNNFGHPMSHGCINMREEDVAKIYEWANPPTAANTTYASEDNPGTLVTIYGTTPTN